MGLGTKLIKNTGYLTIGNQVGNLLQFLFFLYFARTFGEVIVGQYSFAFSFTYMFSVFADLGLSTYLIREVARDRAEGREIFARCLSLRLFSIAVSLLLAVAAILVFSRDLSSDTILIIVLLGLFQVFFSIADVFLGEFKGHDRMGTVALLNVFIRFVLSIAGMFLILMRFDFITVLSCFPIASFIYLITCICLSYYYFGNFKHHIRNLHIKSLFIKTLPFTFTIIFAESLYHQDILMLKFLKDDQAVGVFSVANAIVLALMSIIVFVHTAMLPTFSLLYVDSKSKLIDISKESLRYLLFIGLPIATGLFAISEKLILFLFSDSFEYSVTVLRTLSWTIFFGFAATTYSVLLTAINRQTKKVIVIGICLAFNFMLNLILIPMLSYNGAAAAKLATEALHFILMAYFVSKYLTSISIHRVFIKPALSSFFMYLFIQYFIQWSLVYLIPVSAFVYLFSFGAMRGYSREEIEFVKRLHPKMLLRGG